MSFKEGVRMREIKFRYRTNYGKHEWEYFTIPTDKYLEEARDIADWETLGLYTGLTDANKKEVYEGDILKITNPMTKNSVVKSVWWNGKTTRFNGIPTSLVNVFEVIGNIYSNPELLK